MFGKKNDSNKNRFKQVSSQGLIPTYDIIVDTKTGVNYLYVWHAEHAGLPVMLDAEGKPVVTPQDELAEM